MTENTADKRALFIFISVAILLGGYLRASLVLTYDFPLNDGGLFYAMTQDLIDNQFRLPLTTSYNQAQIVYAYPPAAFYLLGFLNQVLKVDLFELFRLFPLVCNLLVLFLIFPIARLVLGSDRQGLFALFAYAMISPAYVWLVMGGGVTRAPGQLFATLAILSTLGYFRLRRKSAWLACAIFSISLSAYFHIETAWVTALEMALIAVWLDRSRNTLVFLLANALGGVLLLSPYWVTVLRAHGAVTFLNAFSSGYTEPAASLGLLFVPLFTDEKLLHILAVLALLGMFACLAARQYLPILLLLLIIVVNPRSVHRSAVLPEALLIASSLEFLVLQGLELAAKGAGEEKAARTGKTGIFRLPTAAAAILLFYAFLLTALQQKFLTTNTVLTDDQRSAFTWVQENTAEDAAFLLVPTHTSWEGDPFSEWFPALTSRRSVLTVQGYEWQPPSIYQEKIKAFEALVECIASGGACYESWKTTHGIDFDYLLVSQTTAQYDLARLKYLGLLNGCALQVQTGAVGIYRCAEP